MVVASVFVQFMRAIPILFTAAKIGMFILVLNVIALVVVIIWMNIFYYRERKKMTPEERKVDDEKSREENRIW